MPRKFVAIANKQEFPFQLEEEGPDRVRVVFAGKEWVLDVHRAGPHHYSVLHDGQSFDLRFFHEAAQSHAYLHGECLTFKLEDERGRARLRSEEKAAVTGGKKEGPAQICAMMPGKIAGLKVKKGDEVVEGAGVVILEAMKMENELTSPKSGKVTEVRVVEGQSVEGGAVLVVVE